MRKSMGGWPGLFAAVVLAALSFFAGYAFRGGDRQEKDLASSGNERTRPAAGRNGGMAPDRREGTVSGKTDEGGASGISFGARVKNMMRMKHPVDRITAWVKAMEGLTPENAEDFVRAMNEADPKGERSLEWQMLWRTWMSLDPEGCVAYIRTLPEETKTHFAIDVAMNKWAETDPGKAAEFINSLEGGPLYDTALYSYIGRVGTSDLDGAIAMADRAWKDRPEEYNRSMQRLHGEFLFANPGGDSKAFFEQIPSREGKEAAFGHVFYRLINRSVDEAADWLVSQKDFATERAIQRIVEQKNAAEAGSGDAWHQGNF